MIWCLTTEVDYVLPADPEAPSRTRCHRNHLAVVMSSTGAVSAHRGVWYCTDDNPDGEFDVVDPARADVDKSAYANVGLDDLAPGSREPVSLRWVFQHMIEEYARHNGHADLLRERIDGATGE